MSNGGTRSRVGKLRLSAKPSSRNTQIRRRILFPSPLCTRGARGTRRRARERTRGYETSVRFFFACVTSRDASPTNTTACSRRCAGFLSSVCVPLRSRSCSVSVSALGCERKARRRAFTCTKTPRSRGSIRLNSNPPRRTRSTFKRVSRRCLPRWTLRTFQSRARPTWRAEGVETLFDECSPTIAEQTTVKSTYFTVTPAALQTALTNEGLSVTSATTITVAVSAPSPPTTGVTELVGAAKKNAITTALKPKPVTLVPEQAVD